MYISNKDVVTYLKEIKEMCDADKHGGAMRYVREKMMELGFFDTMPESSLDPFRDCPAEWTAFQIAVFDNGEQPVAKRKRDYIERTKMRFGVQIKVWTRKEIDFKIKSQIAWKANAYLWDHSIANQVAAELHEQKLIDDKTVQTMQAMTSNLSTDWRFAIPLLRGKGTKWFSGHLLAVEFQGDRPSNMALIAPGVEITGKSWSEQDAGGKDLKANVAAQMRIGRSAAFDTWATQPCD